MMYDHKKPDFENAAIKATEILIKYHVSSAPVIPLPIIKSTPGAMVFSFTEMAELVGVDRSNILGSLVTENHDAVTAVDIINGKIRYCVAYNQRLPFYMLHRALARELGHIVLGHDGTRPEEVRTEEATCFALHLLCPRPLIQAIHDAGFPLTTEFLGNVTGCYERCLAGMRKIPGVHVPPALNRAVRAQFADYISNVTDFQKFLQKDDDSPIADFGTYMEGYEE